MRDVSRVLSVSNTCNLDLQRYCATFLPSDRESVGNRFSKAERFRDFNSDDGSIFLRFVVLEISSTIFFFIAVHLFFESP